MRVCYSPLVCSSKSSFAHNSPCPLKFEDVKLVPCSPSPVSIVLEKRSLDDKVVNIEKHKLDDDKVEVVRKSSLKKPADRGAKRGKKGNVKWMDFVGKELFEIREFESLESRELDERLYSYPICTCTIM
ncbi:uncharacterized protein LOC109850383 [Asparagus officinalis]|uniref:uncharacterized protein LOC109850383 n=1 Tax=Asparagus officinalis TaxID=4686 RepID=UPI00098E7471|nr:uncharacterized protein LOC109850383 [Asparagus officinalis]